jgi:hypothetical protein
MLVSCENIGLPKAISPVNRKSRKNEANMQRGMALRTGENEK